MLDKNLYCVGDSLVVKFDDEDVPVTGIVDRDSLGRLFLLFPDASVAYSGFQIL